MWNDYSEKWGGFTITKRIRYGMVIEGTKGGKRRFRAAVLSEMGNRVIRLLKELSETERVFPFDVKRGRTCFRAALFRAGISEEGRTRYCLRHTAVTQTIDIDREFAREAFGHTSLKVQERYDHPDVDELFQRVAKAPEILKKRMAGTVLDDPDASKDSP